MTGKYKLQKKLQLNNFLALKNSITVTKQTDFQAVSNSGNRHQNFIFCCLRSTKTREVTRDRYGMKF